MGGTTSLYGELRIFDDDIMMMEADQSEAKYRKEFSSENGSTTSSYVFKDRQRSLSEVINENSCTSPNDEYKFIDLPPAVNITPINDSARNYLKP